MTTVRNIALGALAAALLVATAAPKSTAQDTSSTNQETGTTRTFAEFWESLEGTFNAGLNVSTLGIGPTIGYEFSPSFTLRALINRLDYDWDTTEDGDEYKGSLDLSSQGLLADWHPFDNGFLLTGGAMLNGNEISADADDNDLTIGDNSYSGRVSALVDFDSFAPYLGLGWVSGRQASEPGFSFRVEFGLLFQGDPRLSAVGSLTDGSGTSCRVSVNEAGEASLQTGTPACRTLFERDLKNDIEEEHRDLNDDIKDFDLYPVLMIGGSWRF